MIYYSNYKSLFPFYKDQLPVEVKIDNILIYQYLINVHCQHDGDKIIYILTIPIEYNTQFDLYYLKPIPTLIKDEYFTIIPNFKYVLKNKNFIKPLLDTCSINNLYHCPSKIATSGNVTCEDNIIQGSSVPIVRFCSIAKNSEGYKYQQMLQRFSTLKYHKIRTYYR